MAPKTKDADTRTRILDAAQDLIQRLGANAMSYHDVAEAVRVRKASIHHHFPTKEDLLKALLERYSAYFLGLVDRIVAADIDPEERIVRYASLFEATLALGKHDKACLCGVLGAELATLGSASADIVRDFYEQNEKRLARMLDDGRKQGTLLFVGSSRAMAALIFALLEGAVLIARARGGRKAFREVAAQLRFLVRGERMDLRD